MWISSFIVCVENIHHTLQEESSVLTGPGIVLQWLSMKFFSRVTELKKIILL